MNVNFVTLEQQNFEASTEEDIVRLLMRDTDFMIAYSEHIKPNLFREKFRPIVKSCVDYWKQYGSIIPPLTLVQDLKNAMGIGFTQEKLDAFKAELAVLAEDPHAPNYTADMVSKFIRMQRMENALGQGVETLKDIIRDKDYSKIDDIVRNVNSAAEPFVFNKPELFLQGLDVRFEKRNQIASGELVRAGISTGIPGIDEKMPFGGPERGQLCMFLAPTGRGKSIALKHCSYAAALQGLKVAYFSLELPKDMLLDRMDSMVSTVPIHELVDRRVEVRDEINKVVNEIPLANGFAEIAFFEIPCSSSVLRIRSELEHLKRRYQMVPDVIVVDYMDLMSSIKHFKEGAWREQQEVARELRAFGVETNTLIWTAGQTNRSAINKVEDGKMISDAEAAESYSKQSVADLIISINQTSEERALKTTIKPIKLFIVKNRTGQGGCEIPILSDFSRMCFYAGEPLSAEESALQSGAFIEVSK